MKKYFSTTKTDDLVARIFKAVLHGEYSPGEAVPSEREMQGIIHASRITVRRAYARLMRMGVLERRHGSGTYVPKQRRGAVDQGGIVGLLAPTQFASGVFGMRFINALEKATRQSGQILALRFTDIAKRDDAAAAFELVSHRIRNLIVCPCSRPFQASTFERLRVLGINMVFFDLVIPGAYADFVGLDNGHAVRTLMNKALSRGNRSFVYISHAGFPGDSTAEREAEFQKLCEKRSLPHKVVKVPWLGDIASALRDRSDELFASSKLGVICVNDEAAIAARALVRSAADIYGIDGLPEAARLGVISYAQPYDQMAGSSLQLISEQQKLGENWTARQVRCRGAIKRIQFLH